MLEARLLSALEGLIFALLVAGLLFLVSVLARVAFKKTIGSRRSYAIAIVCGFALHQALVVFLPKEPSNDTGHPSQTVHASSAAVGLDAPSLPPAAEDLESLPAQLYTRGKELSSQERAELSEAVSFLAFASQLAEEDPAQVDDANVPDRAAKALVGIYRRVQVQGEQGQSKSMGMKWAPMTPEAYIDLAKQIKGLKPEWWIHFQGAKSSEFSSSTR